MLRKTLRDTRRHLNNATSLLGSTETRTEVSEEWAMEAGRTRHADTSLAAPEDRLPSQPPPRGRSPTLSVDTRSATVETSHVPTFLSSEGSATSEEAASEAQRKSEQLAMIEVMRLSAQPQRSGLSTALHTLPSSLPQVSKVHV